MSFVDELKKARTGRIPVLHEFLTNYNPGEQRLHAFVEGDDDLVFYRVVLSNQVRDRKSVYLYRCDGKARVYEMFAEVTRRFPDCRSTLFFVDKDVDDILGQPWPTDPRIFVTDVYSVENYIVSSEVLARIIEEFIEFRDVKFESEALMKQFDLELARFHKLVVPLMAWIVFVRRAGMRPNLANIQLRELFAFSSDCRVRIKPGERHDNLCQTTGIKAPKGTLTRVREVAEELKRLPPKRYVRGKFELWFFVEFLKHLLTHLQNSAVGTGGRVRLRIPLEHSNIVALMSGRISAPPSLDLFLRVHLSPEEKADQTPSVSKKSFWVSIGDIVLRFFGA